MKPLVIVLLVALAAIVALAVLYHLETTAHNITRADYDAYKVNVAEDKRKTADAYGAALAESYNQYRANVAHGDTAAATIAKDIARHEQTATELQAEAQAMPDGDTIIFGVDDVRMLNRATGATRAREGVHNSTSPANLHTPGPDGATARPATPAVNATDTGAVFDVVCNVQQTKPDNSGNVAPVAAACPR